MAKSTAEKEREQRIRENRERLKREAQDRLGHLINPSGNTEAEAEVTERTAALAPGVPADAQVWDGTPAVMFTQPTEVTDAQVKNAARAFLTTREGQSILDPRFPSGTAAVIGILEDNAMKAFTAGYLEGARAMGWGGGEAL